MVLNLFFFSGHRPLNPVIIYSGSTHACMHTHPHIHAAVLNLEIASWCAWFRGHHLWSWRTTACYMSYKVPCQDTGRLTSGNVTRSELWYTLKKEKLLWTSYKIQKQENNVVFRQEAFIRQQQWTWEKKEQQMQI